jgi:hypothetical protein
VFGQISQRLEADGLNPQCGEGEKLLYLWRLLQQFEVSHGIVTVGHCTHMHTLHRGVDKFFKTLAKTENIWPKNIERASERGKNPRVCIFTRQSSILLA